MKNFKVQLINLIGTFTFFQIFCTMATAIIILEISINIIVIVIFYIVKLIIIICIIIIWYITYEYYWLFFVCCCIPLLMIQSPRRPVNLVRLDVWGETDV